jgi:hypothetical protein
MTDTTTTTNENAMIWELPKGYLVRDGFLCKEVVTEVLVTDDAGNETVQETIESDIVYWHPMRVKSITRLPSSIVFELECIAPNGDPATTYYDVKHLTVVDSMLLRSFIKDGPYASGRRERLRGFFMDSIAWLHQKETEQPMT